MPTFLQLEIDKVKWFAGISDRMKLSPDLQEQITSNDLK